MRSAKEAGGKLLVTGTLHSTMRIVQRSEPALGQPGWLFLGLPGIDQLCRRLSEQGVLNMIARGYILKIDQLKVAQLG
jgi:hypothetical protein